MPAALVTSTKEGSTAATGVATSISRPMMNAGRFALLMMPPQDRSEYTPVGTLIDIGMVPMWRGIPILRPRGPHFLLQSK